MFHIRLKLTKRWATERLKKIITINMAEFHVTLCRWDIDKSFLYISVRDFFKKDKNRNFTHRVSKNNLNEAFWIPKKPVAVVETNDFRVVLFFLYDLDFYSRIILSGCPPVIVYYKQSIISCVTIQKKKKDI